MKNKPKKIILDRKLCKHSYIVRSTVYSYIPGEAVKEPDYDEYYCLSCHNYIDPGTSKCISIIDEDEQEKIKNALQQLMVNKKESKYHYLIKNAL